MEESRRFTALKVKLGSVDKTTAEVFVIGRDGLVADLWRSIESGSVRLLSERRMGKTWVLHLAIARAPEWAAPVFFDAEGAESAEEFVMSLNKALYAGDFVSSTWRDQVGNWFRRRAVQLKGVRVGKTEIPDLETWGDLLDVTFDHVVKNTAGRTPVIMIDELPFLLDKLAATDRESEATGLLDKLRAIRQGHESLRMVFCGSLGLHIVMKKLREKGYSGSPVNDMSPFEVPALDREDAVYLAGCLLTGENMQCSDLSEVAGAVADASSCVPYYVQQSVTHMINRHGERWTPEAASSVPHDLFVSTGDPAQFRYYDERLDQYYPADIVEKSRAVLDILSRDKDGLDFDTMVNLVRHRPKTVSIDPENVLAICGDLRDDHYIVETDGHWRFKVEVVRQWWYETRGRHEL